ncbi:Protein RALF-like 19 [Linum grandiflorum]
MLKARQRYISYKALAANNIPCGRKGNSYYDCSKHQRVNPYRRGCTAATGCYRWTH